jgi:hypothetical protein
MAAPATLDAYRRRLQRRPRGDGGVSGGRAGMVASVAVGAHGWWRQRWWARTDGGVSGGGRARMVASVAVGAHGWWRQRWWARTDGGVSGGGRTRMVASVAVGAHGWWRQRWWAHTDGGVSGGGRTRAEAPATLGAHGRRTCEPSVVPATVSAHEPLACGPAVAASDYPRTRTTPSCAIRAPTAATAPPTCQPRFTTSTVFRSIKRTK